LTGLFELRPENSSPISTGLYTGTEGWERCCSLCRHWVQEDDHNGSPIIILSWGQVAITISPLKLLQETQVCALKLPVMMLDAICAWCMFLLVRILWLSEWRHRTGRGHNGRACW